MNSLGDAKKLTDGTVQKLIDNCGGCLLCYRQSFDCGSQAVLETLDMLANSNLNGLRVALDLADGQQFDAKSLGRYLLLRDIYRGKGIKSFDTTTASYLLARHGTFDALLGVHSASLTLMFAVPMTRFALKSLESEVKQAADKVGLSNNFKALEDDDATPAAAFFHWLYRRQ